ncbi:rRNA (cytosine-C5-)-methyltransferase RCM1 Ecym_3325 [Eremothecium cymbalariae DBVPG|uniref:SAM-dependent MTase RsmB/NOP-type domain-containing protein n=1 Tax=Eremothecium cymbalariae (strain CBS 270.75 / DBVPG 7215 / KCTC 17166 / NRRL Y-17582) TaxID=931890 RepID=G8JRP6_ERECY|nr:Hypothetical protein Ecym_3325 [Eremothecium cymbalariae DBVPG\
MISKQFSAQDILKMEFYRDSSWVLEYIEQEFSKNSRISGSLQTLVLRSCKRYKLKTNPKHIYAIVSSCWKYKMYLEKIIKNSGLLADVPLKKGEPVFSKTTIMLLVHDLLLSKNKRIHMGKHPIKAFVLKRQVRLSGEFKKMLVKLKVKSLSELVEDNDADMSPVRWIRINPFRCQGKVDDVLKELRKKFPKQVDDWTQIVPGSIYRDEYIPNLYGVHPSDKITSHELYKRGKIIIQDRASCFPAYILNPTPHDVVIDACSAPGNKTTHIAAHIFPDGNASDVKIYAFERDAKRAEILEKMVTSAGCESCIQISVGDFTQLAKPQMFKDVTGFILDPSCSGSGIFGRQSVDLANKSKLAEKVPNEVFEEQDPKEMEQNELYKTRLAKLSSFQFQIVKHAMSFPNAKKLVYSTCSIHAEENERVVIDLLLDQNIKQYGWKVAKRDSVIPAWQRRGILSEFEEVFPHEQAQELADGCIRALPKEDGGIGFFAVCFERE